MAISPNYQPLIKPAAQRLARQLQAGGGQENDASAAPERGTPPWWRNRLLEELFLRRTRTDIYEAYYEGQHRLAFATSKFREAFGTLFSAFADNWCDLVVDASVERLGVEGFRFGVDSAADEDAWAIWQANGLDAESNLAHTEAVKLGVAYVLVGEDPDDSSPVIQVEHPDFAIVELDPTNPRKRRAGLRHWCDQVEGLDYVVLYLPDRVYWWTRQTPTQPVPSQNIAPDPLEGFGSGWEPADGTGRNALGEVPLVPLLNKQRLRDRQGSSDLARVIPLQDAINKLVTDMIVASEFAAYRQRYLTGVEIPRDANGNPISTAAAAVSRLMMVEEPTAKFGEFSASDLSNYVTAVEALIQHVAAQTRTPPHYLLGSSGNFPSGESLKATETGLVAKVRAKHRPFGESWEDVMRLAFMIRGDQKRAKAMDAETIWRNPESRSEAEITDAAVKKATIGVPQEALWEYMGASPQQIERWKKMREEEARLQQINAPVTVRATEQLGPDGQPVPQAGPAPQAPGVTPARNQPGVTPGIQQAPGATPAG